MRIQASLLSLLVFAASAAADDVHLKDGSVLSGKVVDEGSRYTVVDRDRKYAVAKTKVQKVVPAKSFMHVYEARLDKLAPDDAEAIFEFGQWLAENDWGSRARRAYEEVLAIDPDHRAARRALGFKLYEGEWVSPAELNRKKGLVYHEDTGKWYTPHDLAELRKRVEGDAKLRESFKQRRQANRKINGIVRRFQTYDRKTRDRAYSDLYKYAEQLNSPELRKFADDTKAYYNARVTALCKQMRARTEIQATLTRLKKPIETFETSLGAAIALSSAQSPVSIQLPEIRVVQVKTTADIPAGCAGH
ncbi:MAG: hypothetical protein OER88_10805 [Planctomycetota bacterium]|nr:hypothetical protein [Planctomycetota bacterium]